MSVARLRPLAEADLVERTRYCSAEGGTDLAVRFFDAAVVSLLAIERMPNAGSPRAGVLCDIPGLRIRDDPELAGLVEQGVQMWHDCCRGVAQRLADEHRLAEPWTVDTAADLLWTFMFPETLERLTVDRPWTLTRYQELLTVVLRRTIVADPT